MNFLDKLRKVQKVRFYLGLIIVGLFFLVIAVMILRAPDAELVPAEATIVEIEEGYDEMEKATTYTVYIDYEAEGNSYKHVQAPSYSSSMKVGDSMEVFYDAEDPELLSSTDSDLIVYVILAVGVLALAYGLIKVVSAVKQPAEELNEYDRVDMSKVTQAEIDEVRNSDEEKSEYFFHYAGKMNQGFVFEDKEKRTVYEARLDKFSLLKESDYTFINHLTLASRPVKIGKVISTSVGSGNFGYRTPISSAFKIDGVNNWDYLAERGYGFDFSLKGIKPCFDVKHFGVSVAYIETAGTNIMRGEEQQSRIGDLPVNGFFRVQCRNSDIDDVFMVCVSIAKAIFYEND